MLQKNIKLIAIASFVLNLGLGIVIARQLGQISALQDVSNIYRSAACENLDDFRKYLEGYDVNTLFETRSIGVKITAEQKNEWVEKQLSSCLPFPPGSAKAAERLAFLVTVEQSGYVAGDKIYFSFSETK